MIRTLLVSALALALTGCVLAPNPYFDPHPHGGWGPPHGYRPGPGPRGDW
ncbi:MAG: hypothetical protein ACRYHQ_14580 [Janthinobacterium lividum]